MKQALTWLPRPIKSFIHQFFGFFLGRLSKKKRDSIFSWIAAKDAKSFLRWFKVLNRILFKWPISLSFDPQSSNFLVTDNTGTSIEACRSGRIQLYRQGVASRLAFLAEEYLVKNLQFSENDVLIDIGANIGEFSSYFSSVHNIKVLAVEPEGLEFACLTNNLKNPTATIINSAIWLESKTMDLYSKNNTGDSSLLEIHDSEGVGSIQTMTLCDLVERYVDSNDTIKLLKLEAEGAEPEILMGGLKVLSRIEYITADCGPERGLTQEKTLIPVLNLLQKHGFELVKIGRIRDTYLFQNTRFNF